jgi:hypothetical protein
MALVGIRTDDSVDALCFWNKTAHRLESNDLSKNPFDAKVKLLSSTLTVLDIKPVYPSFFWFGLIPVLIGFVLGWSFLVVLGALVFSVGVLWTKYFFYLMILLGLRNEGYKGKVVLVNHATLVRELVGHGSD